MMCLKHLKQLLKTLQKEHKWIGLVPKSETRCLIVGSPKSEIQGFDSWLTSSLRIECIFPLATSDIQMMSATKTVFLRYL